MLIEKVYQGTLPENKIMNEKVDSTSDTYSCDYINNLNKYSIEEQIIGVYNDGSNKKNVYRKIFTYNNALVKDTDTMIGHLGIGVDKILRLDHSFTNGGNTTIFYNYAINKTNFAYFTFKYDRGGGNLWVTAWNEGWSAPNFVVVVEYIKTID